MYESSVRNRPESKTGRRVTKAYHKKSRNGCKECKIRRVKCDEKQPTCSNCERRAETCVFLNASQEQSDQDETTVAKQTSDSLDSASLLSPTLSGDSDSQTNYHSIYSDIGDFQLPESRSRRLLELRLLDFYKDHSANPLPDLPKSDVVTAWSSQVPQLALKYDNVQYMMFCLASCQLLRSEPGNFELLNAQRVYLGLAMHEQQMAVSQLNLENCDSVSYTGMLLLITAIARLWRRPMNPYVPPTECLRLGNGVGAVLERAKVMLKEKKDAKMWLFINAPPVFDRNIIFAKENRIPFQRLLDPNIQPSNPDTHEAYEKAVAYLGYLHKSIQENEPVYIFGRKVMSFSIFVPREYIDLVEEQRYRALVVLAHYFGFMSRAKSLWWAVETPEQEIRAIQNILPQEWQGYMRWPLMMTGQTII
ncbi:hypothetical protein BGW36DRAFT_365269 [Talaromyces proteolyticus]|uniref:Zn(2)-C6 fungal-type domain-containing protein n=1 Tax=Talaromyces proteolyticus TaxID=1131652 RepID=A0AAD4KG10_9EURO|nr:uncharacterized protein BGW36DRAFT_365269 [Talaromyces proteolyticus]KAH8689501.1 hypothetical protein BGW36DRAFT_365269 [Talaromyces proteolyticus]